MKISDFLPKEAVTVELKTVDKEGVIQELLDLMIHAGKVSREDKAELLKVILEREALGSTGIGQGIGIPHGKSSRVKELTGAVGISKKGVNFESLDGELVYIFFLILAPADSAGPHLKALARISRLLKDKFLRASLQRFNDNLALYKFICEEDEKR